MGWGATMSPWPSIGTESVETRQLASTRTGRSWQMQEDGPVSLQEKRSLACLGMLPTIPTIRGQPVCNWLRVASGEQGGACLLLSPTPPRPFLRVAGLGRRHLYLAPSLASALGFRWDWHLRDRPGYSWSLVGPRPALSEDKRRLPLRRQKGKQQFFPLRRAAGGGGGGMRGPCMGGRSNCWPSLCSSPEAVSCPCPMELLGPQSFA